MTDDDVRAALRSTLPSERMKAVQWLLDNEPNETMHEVLLDIANREGVPQIRRAISIVLGKIDSLKDDDFDQFQDAQEKQSDIALILNELSGIIRHEMQPAIGWVRYSASRELADFEATATNRAIEALRRRVDGLSSLAAAHRLPTRKIVSLSEAISACISDEYRPSTIRLELIGLDSDEIYTDPGLMALILSNAIHNAVEASRETNEQILITCNVATDAFWVTIRNRFSGTTFDYSGVSPTGRTSKSGHRGLGATIIELSSRRLGYQFDLQATGGTATFSLRGKRYG